MRFLEAQGKVLRLTDAKLVLANANTTKPLRRRNGLVVLAFANKSVVPRVLGWPGDHTPILALSDFTPRTPPLAHIGYAR